MAEDLMSQGILVPDDLVNRMVAARLARPDTTQGYILDGFPRTLAQGPVARHPNSPPVPRSSPSAFS